MYFCSDCSTSWPTGFVKNFTSSTKRSPSDPAAFAAGFDSGDHLHPSEEAYRAMAGLAFGHISEDV